MRKTSRLALPKSNEERLDPLLHDLGASSPTPNCSGFDLEVEPRAVEMAISLFFFSKAQPEYSMGQPLAFNVDSFVESAIAYCKKNKIEVFFSSLIGVGEWWALLLMVD